MEKQSSGVRWDLASTYVLHPLETTVSQFWRSRGSGKGIGAGRYWGMKGQGAGVNPELTEL